MNSRVEPLIHRLFPDVGQWLAKGLSTVAAVAVTYPLSTLQTRMALLPLDQASNSYVLHSMVNSEGNENISFLSPQSLLVCDIFIWSACSLLSLSLSSLYPRVYGHACQGLWLTHTISFSVSLSLSLSSSLSMDFNIRRALVWLVCWHSHGAAWPARIQARP